MKRLNKFTNTNSSNSTILLIILFIILLVSGYIYFNSYKEKILINAKNNYELNINYLNTKIDNSILDFDRNDIKTQINKLLDTTLFDSIKIEYNRFIFDKNSLINTTSNFDDKSWKIAEVVLDARYGYIKRLEKSSYYEFVSSSNYDKTQPINIRYQVYKSNEITNFVTKLDFSTVEYKKTNKEESNSWIDSWTNSIVTIDTSNKIYKIKKDGFDIATIFYKLNTNKIKNELESFLINLIIFNVIIYLPALLFLGFYHKFIFKRYVSKPIIYINQYLDDILENRFVTINKAEFEGTKEIVELTKKVSKVSSRIASLKNEINSNKDSLEEKNYTDSLTGLPNKTVFDFDIKSMFISSISAYIFVIRVDKLSQISQNHDAGYVNSFIESYSNVIKNIIFKISKIDLKMYRFYGSQFAVIAKNIDIEQSKQMCEEIIEEIKDRMPFIYDVPDDLIHIGGTSFDLYGSLDTVIATANKAYEISKEKGINTYHIFGEKDIEKNYALIDNSVIDVINNANFEIDFVLDSYLFDKPEVLIMSEVSPQLFDHDGKKLSVGSFVSVAQKLKVVDKFDKEVIQKTINFIKEKELTYELAINISINSIENEEFMKWLEITLNKNESIIKNIVFSITSYSAYLHKELFTEFVNRIHKIGAKILLKRYKTDEYPLDQLEGLNLDYIRINKDYTNNFIKDIVKKHKVKNIIIFGELNNINIITDSVKIEADYDLLERLGTYATSR